VLNIRALPEVANSDLGDLLKGCKVPVTEVAGDWKKIEDWIHGDYTKQVQVGYSHHKIQHYLSLFSPVFFAELKSSSMLSG
jgi:hypothetical protein